MNRHQRRALGKENGVRIPSVKNIPSKPTDIKKMDSNFKKIFK